MSERDVIDPEVMQAVWWAQDGRCENCGRAMAQKCARFARINHGVEDFGADNLRLLCYDCKVRGPNPFARGVQLAPSVAEIVVNPSVLVERLGLLAQHGVIVWVGSGGRRRQWWLPGIGTALVEHPRPGIPGPSRPTVLKWQRHGAGELVVKPQARTRGLPKGVR